MGASTTKVKDQAEFLDSPRKSSPMIGTIDAGGKKLESKSKKQHIKLTDLAELGNQLGQSLERIEYISTALERRGVYLEKGLLGEGGSGYILKAFNDRDEKLAVKFVRCENAEQVKQSIMEYKILRQFNSDYITKVKELLQVDRENETYHIIVMERCACDLKQFMRDVKENNSVLSKKFVLDICIQLIQGLDVLHQKNIIHLDIKPANILYGYDKKWKYADLGVSKTLSNEKQHTTHLSGFTASYSSPEQFQMMSYNAKRDITKASDIYSLGIVFLELTGLELNKKWLMQLKLQKTKIPTSNFNQEFQDLNERIILPMIAYEPSERIELMDALLVLNEIQDNELRGASNQQLSPRKRSPKKQSSVHKGREDQNDFAALEMSSKDDKQQQPQPQNHHQHPQLHKYSSQSSLLNVENLDQQQQNNILPPQMQKQASYPSQSQLQPYILQQIHRMQSQSSHLSQPLGQQLSPQPIKIKKPTEQSNPEDYHINIQQNPSNNNDSPLIYSHRSQKQRSSTKPFSSVENLQNKPKIIKLQMSPDLQRQFSQVKMLPPLLPMQQQQHVPSQEFQSRQHNHNEVTPVLALQHLASADYNNNQNQYVNNNGIMQSNNQFNINSNNNNSKAQLINNNQLIFQQQPQFNVQSSINSNNNFSGIVNKMNIISASNGGSRVPSPDAKKQNDSANHQQLSQFNRRHQRMGSLPGDIDGFKLNLNQIPMQQQQHQQKSGIERFASTRQPSPSNAVFEALGASSLINEQQQFFPSNQSQVRLPLISPMKKRSVYVSPQEMFQQQPQQQQQMIFIKEKKSISPFDFFPEQI